MKHYVIIVVCGDIEGSISLDTVEEARAFAMGYQEAATRLDGECNSYTEEELDSEEYADSEYDEHREHIDMHKLKSAKWFWG